MSCRRLAARSLERAKSSTYPTSPAIAVETTKTTIDAQISKRFMSHSCEFLAISPSHPIRKWHLYDEGTGKKFGSRNRISLSGLLRNTTSDNRFNQPFALAWMPALAYRPRAACSVVGLPGEIAVFCQVASGVLAALLTLVNSSAQPQGYVVSLKSYLVTVTEPLYRQVCGDFSLGQPNAIDPTGEILTSSKTFKFIEVVQGDPATS